MRKGTGLLSEIAIFAAGVFAAGLLSKAARRNEAAKPAADPSSADELRTTVAELEARVAAQEQATAARLDHLESRVEAQSAKLAEVPSTHQIVGAMEQLLAKTMTSLDQRLTTQAHSIEALKNTVAQTDSLLERVLESLDSLQTFTDPEPDDLLQRALDPLRPVRHQS